MTILAPAGRPRGRVLLPHLRTPRVARLVFITAPGVIASAAGFSIMGPALLLAGSDTARAGSTPDDLSIALALGLPSAMAFCLSELGTEILKRPLLRAQPHLGTRFWRPALQLTLLIALLGVVAASTFHTTFTPDSLAHRLARSAGEAGPVEPLGFGFAGLAGLGLGLAAWCGQNRRTQTTVLACGLWALTALFATRLVAWLDAAPLLAAAVALGGCAAAGRRWQGAALVSGARHPGLRLLEAKLVRAPGGSNKPPRERSLSGNLADLGAPRFWRDAARFEVETFPRRSWRGPLHVAAVSLGLGLACLLWTTGSMGSSEGALDHLRRSVAALVLGPESATPAADLPEGLDLAWFPVVMALLICCAQVSIAAQRLEPLSFRQLYPLSRTQRAELSLSVFWHALSRQALATLGLGALGVLPLVGWPPPLWPRGLPLLLQAVLLALGLAPWMALAGPYIGRASARAGGASGLRNLGAILPAALIGAPAAFNRGQLPPAALEAAALLLAALGWPLLVRRVRAGADRDLAPA